MSTGKMQTEGTKTSLYTYENGQDSGGPKVGRDGKCELTSTGGNKKWHNHSRKTVWWLLRKLSIFLA